MGTLNLGILAHVDAGKTSLTERILFETGVIGSVGSVDKGTTQTDTMELERARGITIKAAVASFRLGHLTVNLIDTPGHADFIAEVDRSLRVLDAVVLVVSAVEGVQPQTRRLARAVRVAGLPLVLFVNKIDRTGARGELLVDDIRRKLGLRIVPMTTGSAVGERIATVTRCDWHDPAWRGAVIDSLAEADERVIAEFDRTDGELGDVFLERSLRDAIRLGDISPLYVGSAVTGAGASELLDGLGRWLSPAAGDPGGPLSGTVFKVARLRSGEKVVYARLFGGCLAVRQRIRLSRRDAIGDLIEAEERITGVERFEVGAAVSTDGAAAGEIVRLRGLREARIGDVLGEPPTRDLVPAFPVPALESVVTPADPGQITRLRTALEELAEQDPLISLRQRNELGELSVRLYGEVQKEVLLETLGREYGVAVAFGPSRTICSERPAGNGEHVEVIEQDGNPFWATIGLQVEPAQPGSGMRFERELGALPPAFYRVTEETIHETLAQGLSGWEVTDIVVRLTHAGFSSVMSTGSDFRRLTPFVLMQALARAGTTVCEPYDELELEIPEEAYGPVCGALINARATLRASHREGDGHRLVCDIPTAELRAVEQQLPGLTRGDGGWASRFAGYVAVPGDPPARPRVGPDVFNRAAYFADVGRGRFSRG